MFKDALTFGPLAPYHADARLSLLPSPPAGLHSHRSGHLGPQRGYLLYIRHHVKVQSRHTREQQREQDTSFTFWWLILCRFGH